MRSVPKCLFALIVTWGAQARAQDPEAPALTDEELVRLAEAETIEVFDERPDKPFDRDTEVRLTGEELAARGAVDLASATRAMPVTPKLGSVSELARAITSWLPIASRVSTSMTPPGPPGPSIGDCGEVDIRICTMSVIGIVETSNVP